MQTFIAFYKGSKGLDLKRTAPRSILILFIALGLSACQSQRPTPVSASSSSGTSSGTTSGTSSGTTTTSSTTTSSIRAIQLITKTGSTGSFDAAAAPAAGGLALTASRYFNLDGSQIPTAQKPTWLVNGKAFITSTRTQAGVPTYTTSDTPCAYFDSTATDNNPESNGYYLIDGYYSATGPDVDQCAGVAAAELNQLGVYIQVDRAFMNSDEKLQLIVKAKPIDAPTTAPNATECISGGFFDAAICVNQYFTVTMRTAPAASAKPFYILFPSAKSMDLLSESVLLPINISTSITTISVDRVKGGAIIYGLTLIRI